MLGDGRGGLQPLATSLRCWNLSSIADMTDDGSLDMMGLSRSARPCDRQQTQRDYHWKEGALAPRQAEATSGSNPSALAVRSRLAPGSAPAAGDHRASVHFGSVSMDDWMLCASLAKRVHTG